MAKVRNRCGGAKVPDYSCSFCGRRACVAEIMWRVGEFGGRSEEVARRGASKIKQIASFAGVEKSNEGGKMMRRIRCSDRG